MGGRVRSRWGSLTLIVLLTALAVAWLVLRAEHGVALGRTKDEVRLATEHHRLLVRHVDRFRDVAQDLARCRSIATALEADAAHELDHRLAGEARRALWQARQSLADACRLVYVVGSNGRTLSAGSDRDAKRSWAALERSPYLGLAQDRAVVTDLMSFSDGDRFYGLVLHPVSGRDGRTVGLVALELETGSLPSTLPGPGALESVLCTADGYPIGGTPREVAAVVEDRDLARASSVLRVDESWPWMVLVRAAR